MNPLESRKQQLIARCEQDRAELAGDIAEMKAGYRNLTERAGTFGSMISSAAMLWTGWMALKHGQTAQPHENPSWIQGLLKGAGLVSSLYTKFRPKERERD